LKRKDGSGATTSVFPFAFFRRHSVFHYEIVLFVYEA